MKTFAAVCLWLILSMAVFAQTKPCVGAYYFDGWTKLNNNAHLTNSLMNDFKERKPIWGWVTSTQSVIDAQINCAADAGLSFFSFCWYYNSKININTSNNALLLYNQSLNKHKLKFCLMVANHKPYEIGPKDWAAVTTEWIKQFKLANYLKVDNKPLLIFFSVKSLVDNFGSENEVKKAFDNLRILAVKAGLKGVSIAACLGPGRQETSVAENCGFNLLTGYNYYPIGLSKDKKTANIETLAPAEKEIWDKFKNVSNLKYIPLVTLNYDPRPWLNQPKQVNDISHYTGFGPKSVYNSITNCINWINKNPNNITKEKIAILYAWNEYGEGAWLTPSGAWGNQLLNGVKSAIYK